MEIPPDGIGPLTVLCSGSRSTISQLVFVYFCLKRAVMSSVSHPQVATASAAPSASPASPGLPGITRSSSLLFGFLITFLALFVAFMACGVGSRRAMALRRLRLLELAGEAPRRTRQPEPVLWDVWIKEGEETWNHQMVCSRHVLSTIYFPFTLLAPLFIVIHYESN